MLMGTILFCSSGFGRSSHTSSTKFISKLIRWCPAELSWSSNDLYSEDETIKGSMPADDFDGKLEFNHSLGVGTFSCPEAYFHLKKFCVKHNDIWFPSSSIVWPKTHLFSSVSNTCYLIPTQLGYGNENRSTELLVFLL